MPDELLALNGRDALEPPTGPDPGLPGPALVRLAAGLAVRPLTVARRGAGLAVELVRVGLGRSDLDPGPAGHPVLRRLVQTHRAAHDAAGGLVDDAGLPAADRDRLHTVLDTAAPGNLPLDPLAAFVTGVLSGTRPRPDAPPRRTGPAEPALELGTDLAATPGAVVLRTPTFELIQYLPRGETVRAVPLLVVPPLANRHYLADLAPRRSIVEHLVGGGVQVFALSWRNPTDDAEGLDARARALLEALDAVERISRVPVTSLLAFGSGGTVTAALLGHLAAIGEARRAASLTLAGPVLTDPGPAPTPGRAPSEHLRLWATDRLRVPAALRAELAGIVGRDALAQPGAVRVLGTPIDLTEVDQDSYVVAGDLGRWRAGYRGARLLGGERRFVLAPGGPVDALVAPGDPIRAGAASTPDADAWWSAATEPAGSWWTDHLGWLVTRSGDLVDAPPELGGRGLHAIAPTPGDYVHSP